MSFYDALFRLSEIFSWISVFPLKFSHQKFKRKILKFEIIGENV